MTILHEAEEFGQSRPDQLNELAVVACYTALRAVGTALVWGTIIVGGRKLFGDDVSLLSAAITYGVVLALRFGLSVEDDIDSHRDGLRSERRITTYAPQQQAAPQLNSPIVIRPLNGEPYVLSGNERIALPDGRKSGLALDPPTLEAILREVVERHDGKWSRERLMRIRVGGERVTRKFYEYLTDGLTKAGFLQPRPSGGYALPDDVRAFEDVQRYIPALGGRDGGRDGGSRAGNLAESRRQKWLEDNGS